MNDNHSTKPTQDSQKNKNNSQNDCITITTIATAPQNDIQDNTQITQNKCVFLDIDGVLNSDYYFKHEYKPNITAYHDEIDPIRVKRLRNIIEETGAKIILCSSWRSLSDIPEHPQWKYLISSLAAENLHIYDQTTETLKGRPYDIKKYIDDHPEITNYIILDDDYGYAAYRKLGIHNLVQTSFWEEPGGLQDYDVSVAISLLNNEDINCAL